MKKKLSIIVAAVIVSSIFTVNIYQANADIIKSFSVSEAVNRLSNNSLDEKIKDADERLGKLRQAYSGGVGLNLWGSIYNLSIRPLVSDADTKAGDYAKLNGDLVKELGSYNQVYNYWYIKETLAVNEKNKSLAEKEYDIAKTKNLSGIASNLEVSQAQISLNTALLREMQLKSQYDQVRYQMNRAIGNDIPTELNINTPKFQFIDDKELNIDSTIKSLKSNHKSLVPFKTYLNAYNKAVEIVSRQDKFSLPVDDLVSYYNEEIEAVNMKIQQRNEVIQLNSYTYINKLKSLKEQINLYESNIKLQEESYNKNLKAYELGQMTSVDLEKIRLSIYGDNLQLTNLKKDYLLAKEEYKLFKEGYLPLQ